MSQEARESIDWSDTVGKEARGPHDEEFGEIKEIGNTYVKTTKGLISKHDYYLPKYLVDGFDGDKVFFRITQDDADNLFTNEENVPPRDEEYKKKYYDENPARDTVPSDIEQRIPLMSERLRASKTETQSEVSVEKVPVTTTETVQVPVTHEELVVERRNVAERPAEAGESTITSAEEIRVPLKEEHARVTKDTVVREEVGLKKKQVQDTEVVSEEVTSEEVRVKDKDRD